MEPARLLLIFERSAEEPQLLGVGEAIRALGQNDIDVKAVAQTSGAGSLIGSLLRFWFPYLSRAGVVGLRRARRSDRPPKSGPSSSRSPANVVRRLAMCLEHGFRRDTGAKYESHSRTSK